MAMFSGLKPKAMRTEEVVDWMCGKFIIWGNKDDAVHKAVCGGGAFASRNAVLMLDDLLAS